MCPTFLELSTSSWSVLGVLARVEVFKPMGEQIFGLEEVDMSRTGIYGKADFVDVHLLSITK